MGFGIRVGFQVESLGGGLVFNIIIRIESVSLSRVLEKGSVRVPVAGIHRFSP